MLRFLLRPRWLAFHLLVLAGIVLMVNLGFWQLRRLDERQAFNEIVEARYNEPPVALEPLVAAHLSDLDAIEWRPVELSGEFLTDEEIRIVNRSQNGRSGDNVVTPLRLDDGDIVLVNRGFVPLDAPDDQVAPPPEDNVEVVGRVHPSDDRRRGQVSDADVGDLTEAQRIDIERLAPQLPGPVIPAYVDLRAEDSPGGAIFPESIAPPELTDGPHLSYAVQWFLFSVAVAAGWVLAVRHSVRTRRRQEHAAAPHT